MPLYSVRLQMKENADSPFSRASITLSTPRGRIGDGQEGDTGFRRQKLRVIRSVNTVNTGYSVNVVVFTACAFIQPSRYKLFHRDSFSSSRLLLIRRAALQC